MKKIGAMKLHRLLALALALLMSMAVLPAQAATLAGWDGITVGVLYTDGSGQSWLAPAYRVPQEQMTYTWWVTLPAEALNTVVELQVLHPDPAYSYWREDRTLNLHWFADKNATAVDDMYTYYVGYSYNGTPQVSQMQDCMKILLSTMEPPFAYEEESGGAVMLPAGDEGFGEVPGVELITPVGPGSSGQGGTPAPASAVITVYYKHTNGQTLDVRDVSLTGAGSHTLWPESDRVAGLNLVGDYSHTVTVYDGGYTDVGSVTFLYEDAYVAPAEAVVDVYYYHQDGYELDHRTVTLTPGTHYLYPESSIAAQYELVSDDAMTVHVDENGWTDVASVSFIYRDPYVAPVTGEVTVLYVLEDGTRIDSQTVTVAQGYQTIYPESRMVDGLTLVSDAMVNVYVDGSGAVSPSPVTFVYRQNVPQTVQANVTVFIFDTYGNEIAPRQQHTLTEGVHTIEAPAGNAIAGYELISEAVLEVTVRADGSYTPSGEELSFWYRPVQDEPEIIVPVVPAATPTQSPSGRTATVTLRYLDSRGYAVASEQTVVLGEGSHTLTPDAGHVPDGYTIIAGTDVQTVAVRNGRANPATVTFYYTVLETPSPAPSSFDVTVYYYDTYGNEIAPRQTLTLTPGAHWVQANPQNLPAGYALASDGAFQLTVYNNGSLDRDAADVAFWYAKQQVQPRNATITIRYVDGNGRTIAGPFDQELTGGQTYLISPDASLVPQAYDVSGAEPVTVTVSVEGYASPAVVSFVAELRRSGETVPVGVQINRYGVVNANSVALRTEPYSTKSNTVMQRVQRGGMVYMIASEYNTAGEMWTLVIVNGRTGYMKTEFIDVLTPEASAVYEASSGATPVPTFTPAPTPEPTEGFVEFITPVPVTPAPYAGYAVLQWETALRTGTSNAEMTLTMLAPEELVIVSESFTSYTGESWSYVRTLDNLTGYVPTSALRQVSQQEAEWRINYWQQQHATPVPTVLATNTPEPVQLQGYGLTIAGNVPLRRMATEQSRIVDNLPYGTVVFITGQTYVDGMLWQNVAVNGESGYIRGDLVRLMTEREETDFLASLSSPAPSVTPTSMPYDSNGLSSYGYVTTNAVNFRAGASTSTRKLATLNMYAMALVLDTEYAGGTTWYKVIYNGVTGYIHGGYFHQMTIQEFGEFYGSDRYLRGLENNGGGASDGSGTGTGGQVSQEDYVVDDWYASGTVTQPSFAPFLPVPTVQPINPTATPTLEPLPGYVTQGTRQPTATPVPGVGVGSGQVGDSSSDLPLPGSTGSVTYPMQDSEGSGSGLVWVIVIGLLVLAVGGAVVVMRHQRKQHEIAQKAAMRRAQQARAAGGRPYARQGAQQPRSGAYPAYGQQQLPLFPQAPQQPAQPPQTGAAYPAQPAAGAQRPYARQAADAPSNGTTRTGRRTAWQQAHAEQQGDGNNGG